MLTGAPVTERRLTLGGVELGEPSREPHDGPPLVLLHGGIECGGAFWAPTIARLAETHTLVVPDLPGLGESEPLPRITSYAFSRWLAELLQETCAQEPTLVAHSLGGSLAAGFAAAHGDLIRELVICDAPGIGPYRMPLRLRMVAIRFALRPSERNAERFDRFALLDLDRTRARDRQWFDAFMAYTLARAKVPHVRRTMRQLVASGTEQVPDRDLRRIAVPTALIWGRGDRMVPLGVAEEASARLGWPLQVIDEVAHAPQIVDPGAFVETLAAARGNTEHR